MKKLLMTLILLLSLQLGAQNNVMEQTIYQFKVEDIEGNIFDFNTLQGKKIMIVNTASKCGLTPQYKELQAIYDTYGSDDFVIIGFPANDFLSQEPGTNEEIAAFCEKKLWRYLSYDVQNHGERQGHASGL